MFITTIWPKWEAAIKDLSKGQIKFEWHHGGALGAITENYELTRDGVVNMSQYAAYMEPGLYPLTSIIELPLGIAEPGAAMDLAQELYSKYLSKEFTKGDGILAYNMFTTDSYPLWSKSTKVIYPDEMKGMKIRVSGAVQSPMITAAGAAPLTISGGEIYPALDQGLVQGAIYSAAGGWGLKLQEVTKYLIMMHFGTGPTVTAVNEKWWNGLPSWAKDVLNQAKPVLLKAIKDGYIAQQQYTIDNFPKAGAGKEVVYPSADALAKWRALAAPVWQNWVDTNKAKGAEEVMAYYKQLMTKAGVAPPGQ